MDSIAFVFPGQGSQYSGMGKELAANFPIVRDTFAEADDSLAMRLGRLCFDGPESDLNMTENTQPALLATSVAFFRLVATETGARPSSSAGHSLGEYSALVASGALSFADALRTVRARGKYMQEAVPVGTGGMAAILGAEAELVEEICREAARDEVVVPANYNCPGQIVISGHATAVQRAMELAKARGIRKVLLLPVSVPSHCSLMDPAGELLATTLEGIAINPLAIPVVANVTAEPFGDVASINKLLVAQVSSPVRWEMSVRTMMAAGVTGFVEIGPGKVLSGLVRKIDKSVAMKNFDDLAGFKAFAAEVS